MVLGLNLTGTCFFSDGKFSVSKKLWPLTFGLFIFVSITTVDRLFLEGSAFFQVSLTPMLEMTNLLGSSVPVPQK